MDTRALPGGLVESLRALGATLGEMIGIRGALLALELREGVEQCQRMLVMALLAAALLHTGLVLATLAVVAGFWETHRVAALAGMGLLYLGCGGFIVRALGRVAKSVQPFAATLGEIQLDLASAGGSRS
jgi:uncharacterized membrane protein YqjE